jgi:hypothetical protein
MFGTGGKDSTWRIFLVVSKGEDELVRADTIFLSPNGAQDNTSQLLKLS